MAAPGLAQSSAAQAGSTPTDSEEMVCRAVPVVNSRIPQRICRTKADWARLQEESREALSRNRRTVGASGDGT